MICKVNCLSCPYDHCEREKRQKENEKRYYQKHREERLAYQKRYNDSHKEERTAYEKKRWADMKELRGTKT